MIAYQLLGDGQLPYGTAVAGARTRAAQRRLRYRPLHDGEREIPAWIDEVLKKALHPDPYRRYEALSEFVHDLRQPSRTYLARTRPPLMERNPVLFWKCVSLLLAIVVGVLLARGG